MRRNIDQQPVTTPEEISEHETARAVMLGALGRIHESAKPAPYSTIPPRVKIVPAPAAANQVKPQS